MDIFPLNPTSLDLTISVPGFPSSGGEKIKDFDINKVPSAEEEWTTGEGGGESGGTATATGGGGTPVKKLRLTKQQIDLLEESFRQHQTLNPKRKEELAMKLKLKPRQIEVWFQNRRARSKLKQTEMEFEYLKRWFGALTEQNRKLHKEVEDLRRPSTLTTCPQCDRTAATATTAAAATTTTTCPTALLPVFRFRQPPKAC